MAMALVLSGALLLIGTSLVVGALIGVRRCSQRTLGCPLAKRERK
jgi:hypothetical protein